MRTFMRLGLSALALVSVAAIGGCAGDYGYGGIATGYGPGPGYDGYYDGVYGADGEPYYGTAYPGYYGWYGGYYYPGSGFYVYDRDRRPVRWNGNQRHYWQGQQRAYRGTTGAEALRGGANWGGFQRSNNGAARPAGQAFRGGGAPHAGGRGGRHR